MALYPQVVSDIEGGLGYNTRICEKVVQMRAKSLPSTNHYVTDATSNEPKAFGLSTSAQTILSN